VTVGGFNLANSVAEHLGLRFISQRGLDVALHFDDHLTGISLAHAFKDQRHHHFQAGDFIRQRLGIARCYEIFITHHYLLCGMTLCAHILPVHKKQSISYA